MFLRLENGGDEAEVSIALCTMDNGHWVLGVGFSNKLISVRAGNIGGNTFGGVETRVVGSKY